METLESFLERYGRAPVEISDKLPVVEISFEENKAGLAQVPVQVRVSGLHQTEKITDLILCYLKI